MSEEIKAPTHYDSSIDKERYSKAMQVAAIWKELGLSPSKALRSVHADTIWVEGEEYFTCHVFLICQLRQERIGSIHLPGASEKYMDQEIGEIAKINKTYYISKMSNRKKLDNMKRYAADKAAKGLLSKFPLIYNECLRQGWRVVGFKGPEGKNTPKVTD